jgi:hypothetical protein
MTSELAAIEALLMKVLPDPMGFAERVLGELANRLAAGSPTGTPTVVPGYEAAVHDALVDRNILLASALGACSCWGEDPSCADCWGAGRVGWVPPDPQLYDEYVVPALRRAAEPSGSESVQTVPVQATWNDSGVRHDSAGPAHTSVADHSSTT